MRACMNGCTFLVFFIFIFVIMASWASVGVAQTDWKWAKCYANPILTGQSGAWDYYVSNSSVIFDGTNYKMWYSGYDGWNWRIGYATSSDGIHWTRHSTNPVLNPGPDAWDNMHVSSPTVIFDGTLYKMWYQGEHQSGKDRIGYAISTDGIHWNKHPGNPVLNCGQSGEWDSSRVGSPTVIYDGSGYKMWYTGAVDWGKIGYATSSDGIVWEKYDKDSDGKSDFVLDKGASGKWDSREIGSPSVCFNGAEYEMWYIGLDWSPHYRIGYASSADGIQWNRYPDPVLDLGSGWDSYTIFGPTVLFNAPVYEMWYGGSDSGGIHKIGYASSISARIDNYIPNDPNNPEIVEVGEAAPISVVFTNTGNTAWNFVAGATVWDSNGVVVGNYEETLGNALEPGQQKTVNWDHVVNQPGDYWLQFGVWTVESFIEENLLDRQPTPFSQKLIVGNRRPNQPTNLLPVNGSTGVPLTPTLQSSPFSDPDDGDTHAASQWKIVIKIIQFPITVFDSDVDTQNLTQISIPSDKKLAEGFTYYWCVKYRDNHGGWSDWSIETSFRTIAGIITGAVIDSSGEPINRATVSVDGYSDTTDFDGNYNIGNIPSGTYSVTASASRFKDQTKENIVVAAGQPTTINFTLELDENPRIEEIHPSSGAPGIPVTISGYNFNKILSGLFAEVTFGENSAIVKSESWSDEEIIVEVPYDGPYETVEVKVSGRKPLPPPFSWLPDLSPSGYVESNGYPFTYNEPVIHAIKPSFAKPETEVTIEGQYFGVMKGSQFYVEFGKSKVSGSEIKSWTDKEIVAVAPYDLGSGRGVYIEFFESLYVAWKFVACLEGDFTTCWDLLKAAVGKDEAISILEYLALEGITLGVEKVEVDVRVVTPVGGSDMEEFTYDLSEMTISDLESPGELRMYDSQGRITGLVRGEVKEEIPYSKYDEENEAAIVFDSSDLYRYEVLGTDGGIYGLEIASLRNSNITNFAATDIPISVGGTHQYTVDWEVLSQGGEGVTLQMDFNGDGTFEQTITSDAELTQSEFLAALVSGSAKGAGWFVRDGNFRNSFMLSVICDQGAIQEESYLKYLDGKTRMFLSSSSIDSFSVPSNIATFGGECTINRSSGYSFEATVTDANPDEISISVTGPDDFSYSCSGALAGGNIAVSTDTGGGGAPLKLPEETELHQNYPNPFNPDTWIPFKLSKDSDVTIEIYDIAGHLIRKLQLGYIPAGSYVARDMAAYWDGRNEAGEQVASGVYFYSIKTIDFTSTKKMTIVR